ncbi:MAG: hypothetical protein ACXU8N_11130 [Telluria sp.]
MNQSARALAALALAGACAPAAWAAPSTFGPVIGSALLCRGAIDNAYFHAWLTDAFGPPYRHEGGAWWFKADGTLWGASVSDVLVSDDSGSLTFVAAVTDSAPEELQDAIRAAVGVRYAKMDTSAFPMLESSPGSRIVYFKDKSKIYCAKFKQQPGVR